MEVLEIAAGGGQESGGVVTRGGGRSLDAPAAVGEDYLQGEDSEVMAAFSGNVVYCLVTLYPTQLLQFLCMIPFT